MKRKKRLGQCRGFTIVELVAVIAIIGVLAVLLIPTMLNAVEDSQISSANHLAKTIRDRSAEFFTKMDTQMNTHVGSEQTVQLIVQNGSWSIIGGAASDWIDGKNHWTTIQNVSDPGNDSRQSTELLSFLAVAVQGIGTAYIEMHVETSYVIGVTVIEGSTQSASSMPTTQDLRDRTFGFDGSGKAGKLSDGTIIGSSPVLELV